MSHLEAGLSWIKGAKKAIDKAESSLIEKTDNLMESQEARDKLKKKAGEAVKSIKRATRKPNVVELFTIRRNGNFEVEIDRKKCVDVHPDDIIYVDR